MLGRLKATLGRKTQSKKHIRQESGALGNRTARCVLAHLRIFFLSQDSIQRAGTVANSIRGHTHQMSNR
jgi:hypothetical protein